MSHLFDNRHYVIIDSSDLPCINFKEVMETSPDTLRYSFDRKKTFVKYEGLMPDSVSLCSSKSQEYSHSEILIILMGDEWGMTMDIIL